MSSKLVKRIVLASLSATCVLSPVFTQAATPGRQLTGAHAPASSDPLPPAEAQKHFKVPDGFEVRLFAAEPDVINPVAMTWDDRGRLWVVELFEYPFGKDSRDRIKILEDTDGDGRADKVTVFAEKLNLATGILLGNGGAYVGQAPDLLFLRDTNGDDVADERTTLMTGFGLEDRHELLNGFTWGPDGWLYMTHGVFTFSKVKTPDVGDDGVVMDAAVARFHPRTKKFEVFADGTSNPWGVDFDRFGNPFVSACVIDHLFHMAGGGHYVRQAGQPAHPYGYGLIPSIVEHKHFRAAYAGIQIYQGDQYPREYQGRVFMGNIHDNAVNQDFLTPRGASFKASPLRDFVKSDDGWFRSVSEQVGPDGTLWIMDWYDKYPCYQNATADPDGVDRKHGRIWRVVYVGNEPGKAVPPRPANLNLGEMTTGDLVKVLSHPNVWQRRMAQRLLSERRDDDAKPLLTSIVESRSALDTRLAALWTLHGAEQLEESTLDKLAEDAEAPIRLWSARLTGERRTGTEQALARLNKLAGDSEATVRLGAATAARQFVSGSLTVNTPVPAALQNVKTLPVIQTLIQSSAQVEDPVLPFLIWMAAEPIVAANPEPLFQWLGDHAAEARPLSEQIVSKAVRRASDARDSQKLGAAIDLISKLASAAPEMAVFALDGLLESQKNIQTKPAISVGSFISRLLSHPDSRIQSRGQRLGAIWGDETAIHRVLATITNESADSGLRVSATQVARQIKTDAARKALAEVVHKGHPERLAVEAIGALGAIGDDASGKQIIAAWNTLTPGGRRAAAEALISRPVWTDALLSAIEGKQVAAVDIPVTVIRSLSQNKDEALKKRASAAIGRIREGDADKNRLIAQKKRVVAADGPVDLDAGRKLAETSCLVCHKLHGQGAEVGPDLTGVGRSTLDALLANVIDPNQIIGKGYENVEIETKDGRSLSGRVVEDTPSHVKLIAAGPREETVPRAEIASMNVSDRSVMPEGLEQMPDQDFRNLMWFILNPPEDHRPMTAELRKELVGDMPINAPKDYESVALWNPEWAVQSSEHGMAPAKFPEHMGRRNVLVTHPFGHQGAAALERTVDVPSGRKTFLKFDAASEKGGRWVLRVFVNKRMIQQQPIETSAGEWRTISVDLTPYAGSKAEIRLENYAYNMENDYAFWHEIKMVSQQ